MNEPFCYYVNNDIKNRLHKISDELKTLCDKPDFNEDNFNQVLVYFLNIYKLLIPIKNFPLLTGVNGLNFYASFYRDFVNFQKTWLLNKFEDDRDTYFLIEEHVVGAMNEELEDDDDRTEIGQLSIEDIVDEYLTFMSDPLSQLKNIATNNLTQVDIAIRKTL